MMPLSRKQNSELIPGPPDIPPEPINNFEMSETCKTCRYKFIYLNEDGEFKYPDFDYGKSTMPIYPGNPSFNELMRCIICKNKG